MPCCMDEINSIARKHKIHVIEDSTINIMNIMEKLEIQKIFVVLVYILQKILEEYDGGFISKR